MRRAMLVCLGTAILAACAGALPPGAAATSSPVVIRYSVSASGATSANFTKFAAVVQDTLNDPRGWGMAGLVSFRRGDEGAFEVILASPDVVAAHHGCSSYYSCRAGHAVLINDARWRTGARSYRGRALLRSYRQMVINHEVGHALGFGHVSCAGARRLASVMQQQSKGLFGCKRNPWPTSSERRRLAVRHGITRLAALAQQRQARAAAERRTATWGKRAAAERRSGMRGERSGVERGTAMRSAWPAARVAAWRDGNGPRYGRAAACGESVRDGGARGEGPSRRPEPGAALLNPMTLRFAGLCR